jgi:methylamine dehydrogenase heavy chain
VRRQGIEVESERYSGRSIIVPVLEWAPHRYRPMRMVHSFLLAFLALGVGFNLSVAKAGTLPEPRNVNVQLGPVSPHWILYFIFEPTAETSKYVLFDADNAEYKAWITAGYIPSLSVTPDGRQIVTADTFITGPERLRKDYISFYDSRNFGFSSKIDIPNTRAMMGSDNRTAIIGDGRILLMYTFTPASGITVVDIAKKSVVGNVDTTGCALLYSTGDSHVSMICGDGGFLTLKFDSNGQVVKRVRTKPLFDPNVDPLHENAAVIGHTFYFVSYLGDIYPVDLSGDEPVLRDRWSLTPRDRNKSPNPKANKPDEPWRPGGEQMLAGHAGRGELYVLMHPVSMSGKNDQKFPGTEAWVYDVGKKTRTRQIKLNGFMNTIFVTSDDKPLMVTGGADLLHGGHESDLPVSRQAIPSISDIQVYNAASGDFLREFKEIGISYGFRAAPGNEVK